MVCIERLGFGAIVQTIARHLYWIHWNKISPMHGHFAKNLHKGTGKQIFLKG